jgi:hypothetical protein
MRLLRLIPICFAIGALVSFVIAWSCVRWAPPLDFNAQTTAALRHYEDIRKAEHPKARQPLWISCAFGEQWMHAMYVKPDDGMPALRTDQTFVVRAGWPWPCVEGWRDKVGGEWHHHAAIPLGRMLTLSWGRAVPWTEPSLLPCLPRWPQFALTTCAYAAIVGAVWLVFALGRRTWRRWRHRCPCCGYELRGLDSKHAHCPECGALSRAGPISGATT